MVKNSKKRMSQCQKDQLLDLLNQSNGAIPERQKIVDLAERMGLSFKKT